MTIREQAVLDDRYVLDELIGQGGMADVYRGTDRLLLRSVAVKLLREVADPRQRARFIDEARTLAALNHPGLVTLLDAGFSGDRPYLVLELVEGRTLADLIREGALPPAQVTVIGRQLAEALAYAHRRGVVHRDVKPSNVLLVDDRAMLVDFGIARLVGAADHHTRTGDAIGSPAYLAPEQVSGEEIAPAADIFSLGLVLLEALTGLRAYTGSPVEAAVARLTVAPAMPTSLDPGWRTLVARMTHREPADRPSALEVAHQLDVPASAPAPTTAPPADALERTGELAVTKETPLEPVPADLAEAPPASGGWRRRRGRVLALALLLLATVAVAVPVLLSQRAATPDAEGSPAVTTATVATRFRAPLARLHRAVEAAEPAPGSVLNVRLAHVDDTLRARHYPAARRALQALVDDTVAARRSGDVGTADANRVVVAARELLALLPGAAPSQVAPAAPPTHSARHHRGTQHPAPSASASVTPTPSASPSGAPSPSSPASTAPSGSPSTSPSGTPDAQSRTEGSSAPSAGPTG
jgi:tRNA A-37 threonylcarbamoyl transferase component Bud32